MQTALLLLLAVPLAAAAAVALLGAGRPRAVRRLSLLASVVCLILAVVVVVGFTQSPPAEDGARTFHPRIAVQWNLLQLGPSPSAMVQFYVGVDGLNLALVVLTALLVFCGVLVSWKSVTERDNEFFAWLLALETGMIGVFLAFDIILFYVFFELTLIPLFFLIGIWGGPQRQYAARKFFIFTLAGSLITLLGVIGVVLAVANDPYAPPAAAAQNADEANELTFSIPRLVELVHGHTASLPDDVEKKQKAFDKVKDAEFPNEKAAAEAQLKRAGERLDFWRTVEFWVFAALMVGFAVKVPLVPVHTWLPLAHTEAPTAGSVLLAGVLLKIGAYGFLRLCVPLAPDASLAFGRPLIGVLAVIGVIYGSFCALAQEDIKKLVAYSSVAHLGFCMLGVFALNEVGLSGGLLQMINHGLSTGALFLLVGMLYERYHTRKAADYGGMAARLKLLALFMVFITLSSIGLPGLNGFVGETLAMFGMYSTESDPTRFPGWLLTGLAAAGVVLGAWYMLTLLRRVFFGELKEPAHEGHGPVRDLDARELTALVPVAALCLALGVWPQPFFDAAGPDLKVVARIADGARDRAKPHEPTQTAAASGEQPQ
jgi:NADH-quinone oxidoreductase subunit M